MSDNIISFKPPATLPRPPIAHKDGTNERCPQGCSDVELDDERQLCQCVKCKRTLSAWEYLQVLMEGWGRISRHIKYLRHVESQLQQEIEQLEKQKRALQASVRRLTGKVGPNE